MSKGKPPLPEPGSLHNFMKEFYLWLRTANRDELEQALKFCLALLPLVIDEGCSPLLVAHTCELIRILHTRLHRLPPTPKFCTVAVYVN